VGTGTEEDELSTGRIWAAGSHHDTARSRLARVLKLMNSLFLQFSNFFLGRGKPRTTETVDTESVDTGARLYFKNLKILSMKRVQMYEVNYEKLYSVRTCRLASGNYGHKCMSEAFIVL
jgi:hypothetical protein